jgi:hypothetical protein
MRTRTCTHVSSGVRARVRCNISHYRHHVLHTEGLGPTPFQTMWGFPERVQLHEAIVTFWSSGLPSCVLSCPEVALIVQTPSELYSPSTSAPRKLWLTREWIKPNYDLRHLVARMATHGSHHYICHNKGYHLTNDNFQYKVRDLQRGRYHTRTCKRRAKSVLLRTLRNLLILKYLHTGNCL